jgi:D-aspartate ligase
MEEGLNHRIRADLPPAIVLNLSRNGLGVIRSLGTRGVSVIGADTHLNGPGAHSRYCRALLCPDPKQDEVALLAFFDALAQRLGRKAVVFPTSDDYVRFVSKHRQYLMQSFYLALPPAPVVDSVVDKRQTYEAARRLGVPVPASCCPEDEDGLHSTAKEMPYPALIKPTMSHTDAKLFPGKALRVESADELVARYRQLDGVWSSILVQEMIPGGDDQLWTLGAYMDAKARPLAIFCGRKLRQYPPQLGTCSLGECVWDPEVVKLGLRLLKGIGYVGPTQVEFKWDARDGRFKLMEINARTWLWHSLATDGEVDLAYVAYLDVIGQAVPRRILGKPGARWLSIIPDVSSARRYMRRGELSWRGWLSSWRHVQKLDLVSIRDPLPFITTLWRVTRNLAKAIE